MRTDALVGLRNAIVPSLVLWLLVLWMLGVL